MTKNNKVLCYYFIEGHNLELYPDFNLSGSKVIHIH